MHPGISAGKGKWLGIRAQPVRVALGSVLKPAESVQLTAYEVRPDGKMDVLRQLLYAETGQTLVFARNQAWRGTNRQITGA